MAYKNIVIPADGEKITVNSDGTFNVPNNPLIPYLVGDGIGSDITPAMQLVINAAVKSAYQDSKRLVWMEVYAGELAAKKYDGDYFPAETVEALREFKVAIKGPLTTPVGGGFRSLNVAFRQELDLYVCLRPVRWINGVPSPVKSPNLVDMVIFRENSEDIYAGIEWEADSADAKRVIAFLRDEMKVKKIRFPEHCGIGIKPVSKEGTQRLVRRTIEYAIAHDLPSVTLVHKGNIMKFTEGAFKQWGYDLARDEFGAQLIDGGPWCSFKNPNSGTTIVIKDMIADAMLQQVLLRPAEYSAIATLNLNGDYLSDALAAQVGGIGIAPGANLSDDIALFEATHGTAPKYTGLDMSNPCSLILSAEMMLRHLGWLEAADKVVNAIEKTILAKKVTYDFERLMDGATKLKCSEFAKEVVARM